MISFKSIRIQNYKGYIDSNEIEFAVPDGNTPGSGLNILVGENGSGKTTLLKAISMITSSSLRNKITSSDFNNNQNLPDINIVAKLVSPFKYKIPAIYKEVDINEFRLSIKHRSSKSPGRMFSDMFQISNVAEPTTRKYLTKKEGEKTIAEFFLQYDPDNILDDDLNIFYFDRSRHLQARSGYSTTLARALEDLNWKFLQNNANQKEILDAWKVYYKKVVTAALGSEVSKEFCDKFGSNVVDQISLELLNLKEPFLGGFFAKTNDTNLSQIPLSDLGSGVELVFSILFLKHISNNSKGTIIYCIDEPELSLHPQWQKIFFEILKEESKTKQIFIATHSPHFIDSFTLGNVKMFKCCDDGKLTINYLPSNLASDPKIQNLFNLENREIFFSKSTVLVEGWEDKDRIRKFLNSNNNDIFVIVGLQNFERVQKVCQNLGINFKAIVDLDYIRSDPGLVPVLKQDELDALEEIKALDEIIANTTNEIVKKEANKIINKIKTDKLSILSSKIKTKMSSDSNYANKVRVKIESLKKLGTFVLPCGVIEDYLDESGTPISEDLGKELLTIIKS